MPTKISGSHVFIAGAGGVGVSGVALILQDLGVPVCGSDLRESELTRLLSARGVEVHDTSQPQLAATARFVVVPAGFPCRHPEIEAAQHAGIPVHGRSAALAKVCRQHQTTACLSFGTLSRARLARLWAKAFDHAGWCTGIITDDALPHARWGKPLCLDLDEREVWQHRDILPAFAPPIVAISDWEEDSLGYYGQDLDLKRFLSWCRTLAPLTVSPLPSSGPDQIDIEVWEAGRQTTYDSYGIQRIGFASTLSGITHKTDSLTPITGTHADLTACAVAMTLYRIHGIRTPLSPLSCVGWFKPVTENHVHDIRMHPVSVRAALRALRAATPGRAAGVVMRPFAATLHAYSLEHWHEALKEADHVILIDPPYEGCPPEDCLEFAQGLCHRGLSVRTLTHARARAFCQPQDAWLWVGAPDIVAMP
ncbi:MAG: Mur ligase domain-containing protein [Proteobacteria bacterium]|nr:Mur ligase domain-containing protein [Pseudomonadota bacterium]